MRDKIQELVQTYESTQEFLDRTDTLLHELTAGFSAGKITYEELTELLPEKHHHLIDIIISEEWTPLY